jgi:hypothetical protein
LVVGYWAAADDRLRFFSARCLLNGHRLPISTPHWYFCAYRRRQVDSFLTLEAALAHAREWWLTRPGYILRWLDKLPPLGQQLLRAVVVEGDEAALAPLLDLAVDMEQRELRWIARDLRQQVIPLSAAHRDLSRVLLPLEYPVGPAGVDVVEDAYQALLYLGHGPAEAGRRLDQVFVVGRTFASVVEVLREVYKTGV